MRVSYWKTAAVAFGVLAGHASAETNTGALTSRDEVAAIVSEMLAASEERSAGPTAGYADRFFIASEDDKFRLKVGGYGQFRYYAHFTGDDADTDYRGGFVSTRTRLVFAGHISEPRIDFLILPGTGASGRWIMYDVWAKHSFADGWAVQAGQFKLPFLREWLISERFILPVERSVLTGTISTIYSQGVQLYYNADWFRGRASFSDGVRAINSDFTSPREADYAVTARAEFKLGGTWGQFKDPTSLGNEESGALFGLAIHHQGNTDAYAGFEIDKITQYTADFSYEALNWSVMATFVGRNLEVSGGDTFDDFAWQLQGGVLLADDVELFGRYTMLIPDSNAAGDDIFGEVTAGVTWFIHGHALRWKTDVVWYPDDPGDTTMVGFGSSSALGLFVNEGANQVTIRSELQLLF